MSEAPCLPAAEQAQIHNSVTHILHNGQYALPSGSCARALTMTPSTAWRVDFVCPLSAFEPNISGLRTLIDFCLTSTVSTMPRLVFTSSLTDATSMSRFLLLDQVA